MPCTLEGNRASVANKHRQKHMQYKDRCSYFVVGYWRVQETTPASHGGTWKSSRTTGIQIWKHILKNVVYFTLLLCSVCCTTGFPRAVRRSRTWLKARCFSSLRAIQGLEQKEPWRSAYRLLTSRVQEAVKELYGSRLVL